MLESDHFLSRVRAILDKIRSMCSILLKRHIQYNIEPDQLEYLQRMQNSTIWSFTLVKSRSLT
jgi:penicillin-binding protein-related factor A (putative recombinase)